MLGILQDFCSVLEVLGQECKGMVTVTVECAGFHYSVFKACFAHFILSKIKYLERLVSSLLEMSFIDYLEFE